MANSDQSQMSEFVPQHKRIAMGAKLDGTSYQPKGESKAPAPARRGNGALAQAKKK